MIADEEKGEVMRSGVRSRWGERGLGVSAMAVPESIGDV